MSLVCSLAVGALWIFTFLGMSWQVLLAASLADFQLSRSAAVLGSRNLTRQLEGEASLFNGTLARGGAPLPVKIAAKFAAMLPLTRVFGYSADIPDRVEIFEEHEGALEYATRFFDRKGETLEAKATKFDAEYERKVIRRHPAQTLMEYAKRRESFDPIVIGRKGYSALEHLWWTA